MNLVLWLLSVSLFLALPCFSQETGQGTILRPSSDVRFEFPDEYIHVPSIEQQTSPAYRFSAPGIFTVQVNVNESGENILGDAANEPSIAVDATGGCLPYSWAIVSGTLPDGPDLDHSSGEISGKPNVVGTFEFTVLVEDVLGDTDEKEFSIQTGEYSNIKGDVNADCAINAVDVVRVVNIILELTEPTQDQIWRADCNGSLGNCSGDGTINILDAIKTINLILELDVCP